MTKKDIQKLVVASYTKNTLDNKKVDKIVSLLTRADLKLYIRGIKLSEKAKTISLVLPKKSLYNKSLVSGFTKQVLVEEDPSLILGVKVIDNDIVYDMSLKNSLHDFIQNL